MTVALIIFITFIFATILLSLGGVAERINLNVFQNEFLNTQMIYQMLVLPVAGLSLLSTYLLNNENFHRFFRFGNPDASAGKMMPGGFWEGSSWAGVGIGSALVIVAVTAIFMALKLKKINIDWNVLGRGLVWVILFSLTNSFAEEMIFRLGVVSPLSGLLSPLVICLISALIFGLIHFTGMPNGLTGMFLAGLVGFIAAGSMLETAGFFWAWTIHFFQDLVIIGSLLLMNTPKKAPGD